MNQKWKNFLTSKYAEISADGEICFPTVENNRKNVVFPISKLSILSVNGSDSTRFLQGQSTCNIDEVTESNGSFGAFCTPKGRAICTFFIIRQKDSFLLILPSELMEKVTKRLQLYILRSDVKLNRISEEYCLLGLNSEASSALGLELPEAQYAAACKNNMIIIRFPGSQPRFVVMGTPQEAMDLWTDLTENHKFGAANSSDWLLQDLISGIPWLNSKTSEEFIPQMINLDQLNGISFNKGCYTGQEIVARTHYLGKSKRQMFLAETIFDGPIDPGANIIDDETNQAQNVGQVLAACRQHNRVQMLIVMQIANAASPKLRLENQNQIKISLSEFSY